MATGGSLLRDSSLYNQQVTSANGTLRFRLRFARLRCERRLGDIRTNRCPGSSALEIGQGFDAGEPSNGVSRIFRIESAIARSPFH
jgi:hypothetical protein